MKKQFEDDWEWDDLFGEEDQNEAERMEKALFQEDLPELEISDEEVQASYDRLVERLKADGIYREEAAGDGGVPVPDDGKADAGNSAAPKRGKTAGKSRLSWLPKAAAIVIVAGVSVFFASMTGEAGRTSLFHKIMMLTGNDSRVVMSNDETNDDIDVNEYEAREDIKKVLGIDIPWLAYRPEHFDFYSYNIDPYAETARIEYQYADYIIVFSINKQDNNSESVLEGIHGSKIRTIDIKRESIQVDIREVYDEQEDVPCYFAEWTKDNVVYHISGRMELETFIKIIEEIRY